LKTLPFIILNSHFKGSQHITAEIILHSAMIKWNKLCKSIHGVSRKHGP